MYNGSDMKKILLLGDSISMGYREYVKDSLKPYFEVVYPYENGKFAAHVYRMLYEWCSELNVNADNTALIYWNCGLWDVVRVFGDEPQTPIEVYKYYLRNIEKRLKKLFPNAKICFAMTTPVLEEKYKNDFYRLNNEIKQYNDEAKKCLKKVNQFDDLYQFMEKLDLTEGLYKDATHFSSEANKILAKHISEQIIRMASGDNMERNVMKKDMNIIAKKIVSGDYSIALWGIGKNYRAYHNIIQKYCNVKFVIDKDINKIGKLFDGLMCQSPESIQNEKAVVVVVLIDDCSAKDEIFTYCSKKNIDVCEYREVLNLIYPMHEESILKNIEFIDTDPIEKNVMKKYIGINVPAYGCNFSCSYCYLENKSTGNNAFPSLIHSPKYIRYKLSKKMLGGCALIGICGYGETLLADKITELCIGLLKEGHYLHIVTNGIITNKIQEILDKAGEYQKHILFKISFHYLELKKKKLLTKFIENIKIIENSEASFTLELMPHDELVESISEVLKFSLNNFGAYPQLTIGRDEHNGRKLLTQYSIDKYKDIWSVFHSEMFDMRMNLYLMHGHQCNAGKHAFFVDLYNGRIDRCIFTEGIGNIYDDECNYDFEEVGNKCPLDYCYNCHVYATLGLMPEINVPTYLSIRDRVTINGKHWIKSDMRRFLDIKLYETNEM